MKNKLPWHSGLKANWFLWILLLIADISVIALRNPLYAVGITLLPLIVSIDHILWNISDKEEKWLDTGFGCGFRIWMK